MLQLLLLTLMGTAATAFLAETVMDEDDSAPPPAPTANEDSGEENSETQDDILEMIDPIETSDETSDDSSAETVEPSPEVDEAEDQFPPANPEEGVFYGTSDDDLLNSTQIGSQYTAIDLGPGDDVVNAPNNINIRGGSGDDNVTVANWGTGSEPGFVDGGPGDDSLVVLGEPDNMAVTGGDGNDTIMFESYGVATEGNSVDGGEGDDQLIILSGVPQGAESVPVEVSGGAGVDSFSIALQPGDHDDEASPDEPLVTITDFDPDQETVQISAPTGYDVIDVETRTSDDDTVMQIVVLSQNEGDDPISGIIEITGLENASTLDPMDFLTVPGFS